MDWFNGTFASAAERFEASYPIAVTKDLRLSADRTEMAIINSFTEDDPLSALADPRVGEADGATHIFYHTFLGQEAQAAREAVKAFIAAGYHTVPHHFVLYRKTPDELYSYAYGHICTGLQPQPELLPEALREVGPVYILPLKRHMYKCPVCGSRTLPYRGLFEICPVCRWEDDGTDDENEETLPNGSYTIKTWREKYLREKARKSV